MNDNANENSPADHYKINDKTTTSKSSEYKTKRTGSTPVDDDILLKEAVPLKYLSNF